MKRFYISDWHYGHKNILSLDNRPFKNVEEMNAELIRRWNAAVGKDDVVYILGDMFWCNATEATAVLEQLNGQKFLIQGNHDRCHDNNFRKHFEKITEYMEIKDGDKNIVLCHYPIVCFKNHYYGWYHLYGHVHSSFEHNMMEHDKYIMETLYDKPCNMYNVGAMMPYIDYTPRTLEEIINANKKDGVI